MGCVIAEMLLGQPLFPGETGLSDAPTVSTVFDTSYFVAFSAFVLRHRPTCRNHQSHRESHTGRA